MMDGDTPIVLDADSRQWWADALLAVPAEDAVVLPNSVVSALYVALGEPPVPGPDDGDTEKG